MLLRRGAHLARLGLAIALGPWAPLPTWAQSDWQLQNHFQVGVDAWHIDHSSEEPLTRRNMFLADSQTRWTYRELSPWYTAQSQLNFGPLQHVVLRARANQGSGGVLDQLYYDHGISPSLGFRIGVADYRATWCREYDLDNPWVRESDPFCSQRFIRLPLSSAPALQAYANTELGNYQIQAIGGLFRPRALGYAPREFSGAQLPDQVQITRNHKQTLALNALNKATSTEFRLSWVRIDQSLFDPQVRASNSQWGPFTEMNYHQASDIVFAGVSWQLSPRWRSRLTHMSRQLKARCDLLQPLAVPECGERVESSSTVLEWNYQASQKDILSLAVVHFPFKQFNVYERTHRNMSVGWRHDRGQGWFGAVQLSHSRSAIPYSLDFSKIAFQPGTASAWALGTRLGYAF